MKFKAGDPVWCRCDVGSVVLPLGGELAATILGFSQVHTDFFGTPQWEIEIDGERWFSHETHLRPRRPPAPEMERLREWESRLWNRDKVTA